MYVLGPDKLPWSCLSVGMFMSTIATLTHSLVEPLIHIIKCLIINFAIIEYFSWIRDGMRQGSIQVIKAY